MNINNENLEKVKKFIYNDEVQELLKLIRNSVKDFNIFEITGMENQEIKHSNTLAWFFGENEHGLGNIFFIEFLKQTLKITKENEEYIDKYDIDFDKLQKYIYLSKKTKKYEVRREYRNIDILVIDENNQYVFIIENKLDSSESENQLTKYRKIIEEEFKDYNKYFIFLTKDLIEPDTESLGGDKNRQLYMLCSYEEINNIVNNILKLNSQKKISIKDETKFVLENYNDLLIRRNIVEKEENKLDCFCREIWLNKEHRNALEILINKKPSIVSNILDEVIEKDEELRRLDSMGTKRRVLITENLYQNKFMKKLNSGIEKSRHSGFWKESTLIFRIYLEDYKLTWKLIFETRYHNNPQLVNEFRNKTKDIIKINTKNKFTLANNELCKIEDINNLEKIREEIVKGINEIKELANEINDVLD